jgi:flagellar basal-body rod modification protein FlgD
MPLDAVNAMNTSAAYNTSASNAPSSTLDKDGFLKMLTAQIKNQDPSSNQDPSQYFQTISQMSVVEQLTNLAAQSTTQLAATKVSAAENLLGRTVTYVGKDGLPVSGAVDAVDLTGKAPTISVAGVAGIDPATLSGIAQ